MLCNYCKQGFLYPDQICLHGEDLDFHFNGFQWEMRVGGTTYIIDSLSDKILTGEGTLHVRREPHR